MRVSPSRLVFWRSTGERALGVFADHDRGTLERSSRERHVPGIGEHLISGVRSRRSYGFGECCKMLLRLHD